LVNISGSNDVFFYRLVQEKYIDWRMFSSVVLNRFDLYYSRTKKIDDQISDREFLQNSQKELNRRDRNVSLEKNSKGFILKIGNRRSNNYFRIYQGKNSLKFEHEMKGKFLQKYHSLLVENRLEEFEQKLSSHFLISFGKLLPLKYSYMDWLVIKLRPIRKSSIPQYFLNMDYVESKSLYLLSDPKKFVMLLQFLTYTQQLDFKIDFLGYTSYRTVHFRIDHFLKFQNPTLKSTSYYKLKNARKTGGSSLFLQDFTPQRQYGSRPINNKPLSCRNNVKINQEQFNGNQNLGGSSSSMETMSKRLSQEYTEYQQKFNSPDAVQNNLLECLEYID
jgi:hypothetical protein